MNKIARTVSRSAATGATKLVREMLDLLLATRERLNQASDELAILSLAVQRLDRSGIKTVQFQERRPEVDAVPGDYWICDVTTQALNLYLPAANGELALAEVRVYLVNGGGANGVTIRVRGGGTVNGSASHSNSTNHGTEWLTCTGKEWITK